MNIRIVVHIGDDQRADKDYLSLPVLYSMVGKHNEIKQIISYTDISAFLISTEKHLIRLMKFMTGCGE
jgi:hypothetical protein